MNSLSPEVIQLFNKQLESAFEVVFNVFYPRLVYFAKEYVPYSDAQNLVQDAFVAMWKKKPEFVNEAQLQSYLYTNVKNHCLMFLRHEKVKKQYEDNLALKKQNQLNAKALEHLDTSLVAFQEIENIIYQSLEKLPPKCLNVFELSRFEGKKNIEIANELNISIKAVEAQITKALKVLRISLKDYLLIVTFLLLR